MSENSQRPILIIDSANLFIRSYSAYPTMSSHGYQMGGCIGFLKSLKRLTQELNPSAVYIVWEGGGSQKRRAIYSDYKLKRRPEKLNRFYEDDIPDSEENKKHQLIALLNMLKNVPICQLYVSDCEGDDTIAYLCRGPFRDKDKIIASSDKDMYQLLDDKTRIYNLHKKIVMDVKDVVEEFRIHPQNFAVAKALCGDPGDNVPGIKGLGFKTLAKVIPFLSHEGVVLLEDVIKFCHSHSEEKPIYQRIVENESDVKRNYRLVYLDGSMLSHTQSSKIDHMISTFVPRINRIGLIKALVKEGINDFDTEGFFYIFNGVNDGNKE